MKRLRHFQEGPGEEAEPKSNRSLWISLHRSQDKKSPVGEWGKDGAFLGIGHGMAPVRAAWWHGSVTNQRKFVLVTVVKLGARK
jgi:hypothetical protein